MLTAALVLWAAVPAHASTVTTRVECESGYTGPCTPVTHVDYTAAPGEQNDLTASYRNGRVTFSDRVPIAAPRACQRDSPTRVTCSGTVNHADLGDLDDKGTATNYTPYGGSVSIAGGDGNDTLVGHAADVDGGEGDDRLTGNSSSGGPGSDVLIGTDGADRLAGGAGADELHGGRGDDRLDGDGGTDADVIATDTIDGGPGADEVSYASRLSPVEVDIGARIGGAPGEKDVLQGIEDALGGAGADRLVGDDGANVLDGGYECRYDVGSAGDLVLGGGGNDVVAGGCKPNRLYGQDGNDRVVGGQYDDLLEGGAGNDVLEGGFGVDKYIGGPGNDRFGPNFGDPGEDVSCGDGIDAIEQPGLALVSADCETVTDINTRARAYPTRPRPRELRFTIHCPVARRPCTARVRLKVLGRRNAFAIANSSARKGVLRPRFRLPKSITDMQRSPLPIRVIVDGRQRQSATDQFDIQWVFDLSATPAG